MRKMNLTAINILSHIYGLTLRHTYKNKIPRRSRVAVFFANNISPNLLTFNLNRIDAKVGNISLRIMKMIDVYSM